jgi:hypothetical protein
MGHLERDSDGDRRGPRAWAVGPLVGRPDRRPRVGRRHRLRRWSDRCTWRCPAWRRKCIRWSAFGGRIAKALRHRGYRRPEPAALATPSLVRPVPRQICRSALRRSMSGVRPGSGRSQRAIGATSSVWSVAMTVPHRETPEADAPAHHNHHHHHDDEHHDRTAHHALALPGPGVVSTGSAELANLGPLGSVPRIGMAADVSITACTAPERPRRAGGSQSSRRRARCHRSLPVPRLRPG